MNPIDSIDPKEFLDKSRANHFHVFIITRKYKLFRTRDGWMNPEVPLADLKKIAVFCKQELVEAYYQALREAKEDTGAGSEFVEGGFLQVRETKADG
jgi:hypothetical protein